MKAVVVVGGGWDEDAAADNDGDGIDCIGASVGLGVMAAEWYAMDASNHGATVVR